MENSGIYAEPREVADLGECYFYHTIDLPGHDTIHGSWDLRGRLDEYLGLVDFKDQRVLDAGTGNGLLAFTAERRGAREVVAFDLAQSEEWDIVPYADRLLAPTLKLSRQEIVEQRKQLLVKLNNAFWYCHKALDSRVKMCYGTIYDIPAAVGPVDIVIFGAILLHLRNPLSALEQAAKLDAGTIIVTDLLLPGVDRTQPMSLLVPTPQPPLSIDAWWGHSPALIANFLQILGYVNIQINYHTQIRDERLGQQNNYYTVVGRR